MPHLVALHAPRANTASVAMTLPLCKSAFRWAAAKRHATQIAWLVGFHQCLPGNRWLHYWHGSDSQSAHKFKSCGPASRYRSGRAAETS